MDGAGQVGVQLQLTLGLVEVVVGLRLLKRRLPVLIDHDERGQEDGFQRHEEREQLERVAVGAEEAGRTQNAKIATCTQTKSIERANVGSFGEVKLPVVGSPLELREHDRRMLCVVGRYNENGHDRSSVGESSSPASSFRPSL